MCDRSVVNAKRDMSGMTPTSVSLLATVKSLRKKDGMNGLSANEMQKIVKVMRGRMFSSIRV